MPDTLAPPPRTTRPPRSPQPGPTAPPAPVPPLRGGERLGADEFLRRYEAMPEDFRAELIAGVVRVRTMPVSNTFHGNPVAALTGAVWFYSAATPGTQGSTDATTRLNGIGVPQPDTLLRVLPSHGGQTVDLPRG